MSTVECVVVDVTSSGVYIADGHGLWRIDAGPEDQARAASVLTDSGDRDDLVAVVFETDARNAPTAWTQALRIASEASARVSGDIVE